MTYCLHVRILYAISVATSTCMLPMYLTTQIQAELKLRMHIRYADDSCEAELTVYAQVDLDMKIVAIGAHRQVST